LLGSGRERHNSGGSFIGPCLNSKETRRWNLEDTARGTVLRSFLGCMNN
jgi:hypothetical protein